MTTAASEAQMKEERDAESPMMRRMVALLFLAVIALAGCDSYYEFKVRNVCDQAVQVALLQGSVMPAL